ncbi:D-glycero-beta-D-manno-heptose 1-phosphate adenylyltransferase [Candidatus Undinarchaeota archaeon]
MSKVKELPELEEIVSTLKGEGGKIVFTNGVFDILHVGHIKYLEEAKGHGDTLIVGLNSDSSVKKIKGEGRPINDESSRASVLSSLSSVDYIVIFSEDTPEKLISALKPDVHVKGGDYNETDLPEAEVVKSYGGKIIIVPLVEGYSTTSLIEKMKQ